MFYNCTDILTSRGKKQYNYLYIKSSLQHFRIHFYLVLATVFGYLNSLVQKLRKKNL
jgi:hypothetical protein